MTGTTVIEDACFNRARINHAINLFDMRSKYSDVVHSDEVATYMMARPTGMFELPTSTAPAAPQVKKQSVG